MIQEKREMCKACATGNEKRAHNGDLRTCIKGRSEYIKHLPPKKQMEELIIHERLSKDMADFIINLALERKKNPYDILEEEGLSLTNV
jgi:hypothetical protein